VSLPAGAVVFEEDQKGDSMYVVLSGSCQVRARPLTDAASHPQDAAAAAAAEFAVVAAGAAGSAQQQQQRRSTLEVAAVGGSSSGSGAAAALRVSGAGARRTTWEGVAFTAQEQAKLEAVKAALDANKQQVSRVGAQN
jgi:hypothetical protein